ncbi:MAG: helix-turn-helix transcriptional regulator [Coriobacteriales bacterium]
MTTGTLPVNEDSKTGRGHPSGTQTRAREEARPHAEVRARAGAGPRAAVCLALCFVLVWYLESMLVGLLDQGPGFLRPVATGAAALACLAILMLSRRVPRALAPAPCSVVSAALGVATVPLTLLGGDAGRAVSCVILGPCTVWSVTLAVTTVTHEAGLQGSLAGLAVKCSAAAAVACAICTAPVPGNGSWLATILAGSIPLAIDVLAGRDAVRRLASLGAGPAPIEAEVTQPESFLPFSSRLFVALALLSCAVGSGYSVLLRTGLSLGVYQLAGCAALLVMLAAGMAWGHGRVSATGVYWGTLSLAFVGMLLGLMWPYSQPVAGPVALTCLVTSALLFFLVLMLLVATMSAHNSLSTVALAAFAVFAVELGLSVDGVFWIAAIALRGVPSVPSNVIMLGFFVGLVLYNMLFIHGYDFDGVAGSLRPVEHVHVTGASPELAGTDEEGVREAPPAPRPACTDAPTHTDIEAAPGPAEQPAAAPQAALSPSLDERCELVAGRFGLTARETDVLRLLARGYSGLAIQEKLVVSRNTVKTHVRNVYSKLDVHSQQELIDLVEAA